MNNQIDNKSYDAVPYESYPYPQSCPEHLKTIGTLFGMNPPALETARVLELGCAAGGNLMPFAANYPKSHCVGVDLSPVQINDGNELLKHTNIKNLELKCMSITDIDESMGKFDYIITHGVFSWVPDFVRDKMLDICGKMLTDNGMVYISYNTLPGWNMVRSLRDMMLFHSSGFQSDQEKINQSRLLLEFIKDSTEGSKTPYAEFLRAESQLLANQPDHYLRHEHLEDNNVQFYFSDFMAKAAAHSLQYVGDSSLASMFVGNLPKKAAEKLSEIKDIVRVEQYMDYVTNRRFRSSILCKSGVQINRSLNLTDVEKFYLNMKCEPEKAFSEVNLEDSLETLKFFFNGSKDVSISTSSPFMKAILYTLAENSHTYLKAEELYKESAKKIKGCKIEDIKTDFLNNAMRLVLSGYINIRSDAPKGSSTVSDKPKVTDLVRAQSLYSKGLWVSNQRHERLGINIFDKVALRYLDGKNTIEDIKAKVMDHITSGELTISKDGAKLEDKDAISKELDVVFKEFLPKLARFALLV